MHNLRRTACFLAVLSAGAAIALSAQTLTTLHSFNSYDGAGPVAALVQGTNGSLYGTSGGTSNGPYGTVFKMTASGTLTALYFFCSLNNCADGAYPAAPLEQATNGMFYGTTCCGGVYGSGTVFMMASDGSLTTLYDFCSQTACTDGGRPFAAVALGSDGNFYGTTSAGGVVNDKCPFGCGTVFKITPTGTYSVLHSFEGSDGSDPQGALIQATDGSLYGTTYNGGTNSRGTVFKITLGGVLTTISNFCSESHCSGSPMAGLLEATDGNFYGTSTSSGGTVFKLTESGAVQTLYQFCSQTGCPDGEFPDAALIQATDGYLYGTTSWGGTGGFCSNQTYGCGTIFRISASGSLTSLYSFCSQNGCTDGEFAYGALVQDTDGNLFGTTDAGGTSEECDGLGCGTVFELSVGLGPFIELKPPFGRVGTSVAILGTALKGATSVTFNGTPATFTKSSPSEISTRVPSGATTGTVQVTVQGRALKSNLPFRVVQ